MGLVVVAGSVGDGEDVCGVKHRVVAMTADRANDVLRVVLKGQGLAASAGTRHHALKPHGGHVDGRLNASENKEVVDETAKGGTQNRRNNGDPKVVATGSPDLRTVADDVTGETGAKVTRGIHGVAGFPAKRGAQTKDKKDENQRTKVASRQVVVVVDGVDAKHEDGGSNKLGKKHAGARHKGRRVCAENATSTGGAANGAHTHALVHVKRGLVVAVNNKRADKGTHELGKDVDGELLPGKAAKDAVGKRDGRVEVATGDTTRAVDAKHDADTPRPRDGLVGTVGVLGHDDLGNDTVSKENDHHCANELGKGFSEGVPNAGPKRQV